MEYGGAPLNKRPLNDSDISPYALLLLQVPVHRLQILQERRTACAIVAFLSRVQTGREVAHETTQFILQRMA